MQGRQGGAVDGIGHGSAQVGVQHGGAHNAQQRLQLLVRNVGSFKNTGLSGFHQVHDLVANASRHGGGDGAFVNRVSQALATYIDGHFHGRGFLLQKNLGSVRHFDGQVFDVGALQAEAGLLSFLFSGWSVLIGHG